MSPSPRLGRSALCLIFSLFARGIAYLNEIMLLSATLFLASTVVANAIEHTSFFGGENNDGYLEWVETIDYESAVFLPNFNDATLGAAIHWSISEDQEYVDLGIAVRATGWLGFGLSDNGGMTGADILLFEAAKPDVVVDAFVTEERFPQQDECQSWEFVDSKVDDPEFLMVQVRRKLDTGDTQDHKIRNDADPSIPIHRIITAWGDDKTVGFHGVNNARGSIRWFSTVGDEAELFQSTMKEQNAKTFFLGASNFSIAAIETEYKKFCFSENDLRAQGVPMDEGGFLFGFDALVDNVEHVHHYVLTAGMDPMNENCDPEMIMDIVYIWAPGDTPLILPDNVGFALGGDTGFKSFSLEIHYDNPLMKEGAVDSSGINMYYSLEAREHTAGVMIMGDSVVALAGESIPKGLADYEFHCPGECSTLFLDEPVTVVREMHHMHQSGVSSYNEQIRNGTIIRTGRTDFFDFHQQGGQVIQQDPFTVMPGDSFNTRCFFRNSDDHRHFGLASGDEMCMTFFIYYPRKMMNVGLPVSWMCGVGFGEFGLTVCDSTYETATLTDDAPMQRVFGTPASQCAADSGDVGDASSANTSTVVVSALLMAIVTLSTIW